MNQFTGGIEVILARPRARLRDLGGTVGSGQGCDERNKIPRAVVAVFVEASPVQKRPTPFGSMVQRVGAISPVFGGGSRAQAAGDAGDWEQGKPKDAV